MARFYEKIIGCRNEGIYRVVTIFGIKFKRKNARVQTLAEIKKLSVQCANLAVSIRTLSEFSKRSHETINALLSKELIELNSQLAGLNEVSRRGHQATAQNLDEANSLLQSHAEMLADFRKMQEDVNRLQGQSHQATAQKLDEASNLLKTHGEKLAEFRVMQEEANKLQGQSHQAAAQKLDEARSLLKAHAERLAELRTAQAEANKVQGQSHQATAQKLDEAHNLLKAHGERLAELRVAQEEVNKLQGQNHQATAQKLNEAHSLLKTHGERLAELRTAQEEANKVQGQSHQATAQKLDEARNLLKTHGEKLAEFRVAQEEANKVQGQSHQATTQKLDEAHNLLKSHAEKLAELRVAQEEANRVQGESHQATAQKLDEAHNLLKTHAEKLAELRVAQEEANRVQGENHQATAQKLDEANNLLKSHTERLAEFRTVQEEANKVQGQSHQATAQKLDEAHNLLKSHAERLAEFRTVQEEANKVQGQSHQATAQKLDEAHNLLKTHAEKLAEVHTAQGDVNKVQRQNHQETTQKLDETIKLARTGAGKAGYLLELEYGSARYYQNAFERGFLIPMFDYMDRTDFEEKYLALIHGMASSSIREINKILSRVAMVKASPDQAHYNFYSVSEQDEKTKLRTDFDNQILRISDNLYAYDKYLLPIRHFEACVFLYKHGIDLVRDKESIRKKDIIDAGGFIGDSALVLSDYTNRKIYSFEANPRNFDLMQKTLEINHLSDVVPVQKALWSSETELELNMNGSGSSLYNLPSLVNENNPPVSLPLVSPGRTVNGKKLTVGIFKVDREGEMHAQGSGLSFTEVGGKTYVNETVRVPTVTLDRFVEKKNIRVGLIKVDLEGAELEFLKGAEHTIRTQKPVLLLSIYHQPSDFFELKPLLEQWVPGYEFSVFNPVDWGILLETMIVAQPRLSLSRKS